MASALHLAGPLNRPQVTLERRGLQPLVSWTCLTWCHCPAPGSLRLYSCSLTGCSSSAPVPFILGAYKSSSSLPGFLCSPQTLAFGPIPITRNIQWKPSWQPSPAYRLFSSEDEDQSKKNCLFRAISSRDIMARARLGSQKKASESRGSGLGTGSRLSSSCPGPSWNLTLSYTCGSSFFLSLRPLGFSILCTFSSAGTNPSFVLSFREQESYPAPCSLLYLLLTPPWP